MRSPCSAQYFVAFAPQLYKGGVYEVIGVAKHSETKEKLVVYKHDDGEHIRSAGLSISSSSLPQLWVRPLAMFTEMVEVNGQKVPRFRKL